MVFLSISLIITWPRWWGCSNSSGRRHLSSLEGQEQKKKCLKWVIAQSQCPIQGISQDPNSNLVFNVESLDLCFFCQVTDIQKNQDSKTRMAFFFSFFYSFRLLTPQVLKAYRYMNNQPKSGFLFKKRAGFTSQFDSHAEELALNSSLLIISFCPQGPNSHESKSDMLSNFSSQR